MYVYMELLILFIAYHCLVDGSWGEWEEWKMCAVQCGGGNQTRNRLCNSPEPDFGGKHCTYNGSSPTDIQKCNEHACLGTAHSIIN